MTKKRHLTRDEITASFALRRQEVPVLELGTVLIQEFSAAQRLAYIEYLEIKDDGMPGFKPDKAVNLSKLIISLGVINEDGTPMWKSIDDVPELRDDANEAIGKAILRLSGIIPAEVSDTLPNAKETSTEPLPSNSVGTSEQLALANTSGG